MLTMHLRTLINTLSSDFQKQVTVEDLGAARSTLSALLGILAVNQPKHANLALASIKKTPTMEGKELASVFGSIIRNF